MDHAILGQIALGYSPIIDQKRNVAATRLTVFPLNPAQRLDAAELVAAVSEVWPADGGNVSLSVRSEQLLNDLLAAPPASNVWIEVPGFVASDPQQSATILAVKGNGNTLLLAGRPTRTLPSELLPCFKYSIVDLADDRRVGETTPHDSGFVRSIGFFQDGIRSVAEMEASFRRGAQAVLGWPIEDALETGRKKGVSPDMQMMVELMNQAEREEPLEKLDATLRRDPTVAYKLMRYINSPAFGLSVEISSFNHAIMLLGYKRLKRWLALLLATASKDANMRPVMFAAVRRGMLMEALAGSEADETMRGELFICGVFSLLDRMLQQPFPELLASIPVPAGVYQALAEESGPYEPHIRLVRSIELGAPHDIREAQERLMLHPREVNQAVMLALAAAAQID